MLQTSVTVMITATLCDHLPPRLCERTVGPLSPIQQLRHHRHWSVVRRVRRFLAESERWSDEELRAWQWGRLREVLEHAFANVPYYRALDLDVHDFHSWPDFTRLPLLEKSDLQEHREALVADNVSPRQRLYVTTGGSSGTPVGFWLDVPDSAAAEWAFITTQWQRVGYRDGDRTVVLRGSPLRNDRAWEYRPRDGHLLLSSYRLVDIDMETALSRLARYRPRFIQAYPSSIGLLSRYILDHGRPPLHGVAAVLAGSENLYPRQRALIEQATNSRVYSWYGQSEHACLAGECEDDSSLHIFPQYSVTELIDDRGETIQEAGCVGEVVGTRLWGFRAMPLIRYRTGDMAVYAAGRCPRCNRPYKRFERIEGRIQEFIVGSSGRPVSMTAINMHTGLFDTVRQFRFVQRVPGEVILRIVPRPSWSADRDEMRIRRELERKLRPDIALTEIQVVDDILPPPSGKHTFLEQHVDIAAWRPELAEDHVSGSV